MELERQRELEAKRLEAAKPPDTHMQEEEVKAEQAISPIIGKRVDQEGEKEVPPPTKRAR